LEEFLSPGLFRRGSAFYTRNLVPGERVYGEEVIRVDDVEYRRIDPWRSKLGAFLHKGGRTWPWGRVRRLLYLGASSGTTVSHLSDILAGSRIYALEKSPRPFALLLELSSRRPNVIPLLADAQRPELYSSQVGPVEGIYQDLAQRDQARILRENAQACLKPHSWVFLQLKCRSVTQTASPRQVLRQSVEQLRTFGFQVQEEVDLSPYSRDHYTVVARWG
jgi:fibrillarin-like pre-rRNA processing protein